MGIKKLHASRVQFDFLVVDKIVGKSSIYASRIRMTLVVANLRASN